MSDLPVIAIDGPSGSGKGAISQRLAAELGFNLLDSGALYRLVGLAARREACSLLDEGALKRVATDLDVSFTPTGNPEEPVTISLAGEDVTRLVRTDEAGVDASSVARFPAVREALRERQRAFVTHPGLVADGRDMATVVFKDAKAKIYLTATAEARAERRYKQLIAKGISVSLHDLFLNLQERDERDMNREVAPLKVAEDAVVIDSTQLDLSETYQRVREVVQQKVGI